MQVIFSPVNALDCLAMLPMTDFCNMLTFCPIRLLLFYAISSEKRFDLK